MDLQDRKNPHFIQAVKCSLAGLKAAFTSERNLKIDLVAGLAVIALGLVLDLGIDEWLWLSLAMTGVLVTELLNTALERVVDLTVGNQWHPLAKEAKDIAAGAVLIAAFQAMLIGALIFGPYLLKGRG
ncbi:diacylglycerol kinase [Facklamia languida]